MKLFKLERLFSSKKGQESEVTPIGTILTWALILLFFFTMAVLIYTKFGPNPERVAGCFTETVRIGPFA